MRTATTVMAITVVTLLTLGAVMVYSAMMTEPKLAGQLNKHYVFMGIGIVLCILLARTDYTLFKKSWVWLIYGFAILLLLLVFAPGVGTTQLGSSRWIRVAGFSFQSSEFAKGALILALAAFLDHYQRRVGTFRYGVVLPSLIIAPVVGLIFIEPDMGTTLTLGAVATLMLLIAGVRWMHVLAIGLVGLICVGGYIAQDPVRLNRIDALLNPEDHSQGAGMQARFAQEALTTGGYFGVGLGDSRYKQRRFIPLHYSDFIYSVIGAELGLVGAMGTILLFVALLICGTYVAWHARDLFGMLVATGLTFFICLQAFIHMGVVMGVLPNKGFPLPFISHGGTNLIFNLVSVGILTSIARRGVSRRRTTGRSRNPFHREVEVPVASSV